MLIFFFTSGLHRDAKVFLHPTAQSLEHLAKEILDNKWEYRLLLKLKTNGNSAKLWNLHQKRTPLRKPPINRDHHISTRTKQALKGKHLATIL